jgi:hypothetical protein
MRLLALAGGGEAFTATRRLLTLVGGGLMESAA